MAMIFESVKGLIHDTSAALVENQIVSKVSNTVTSFLSSGFGIVDDTLRIVRDLTAPTATSTGTPSPTPSPAQAQAQVPAPQPQPHT